MDLGLYLRVIWRFRIVMAIGLLLAIALAFLSFVRVSFAGGSPKFAYRQSADWQGQTTFVLSGPGFAVGSINGTGANANPISLARLAAFYARMVVSDDVQRIVRRSGPINGVISAQPGVDNLTTIRAPLPLVTILGDAPTPASAIDLTRRGARAFQQYVVEQQDAAGIPVQNRVQLRVVNTAREATLAVPRKKTLPIVIFLAIMTAAIGLAFVLENLRPRVRPVMAVEEDERSSSRRSA